MQNDLNIRQTMTSVISMALDKDSVKKFEEASARASEAAAKQSVAEFQEAFGSLADILNKALSKFNIPEIDISDMIKTSGPNEFKALGEKFSTKFAEGFKESLVLKSVFLKEIEAVNDALTRKQKAKSSEIKSNFQKEVDKLGDTSWTKTTIRGLGNKLGSIRSEFDAAENWEDQYVILLKYLQGYEALEKLYADAGKTIDDISEKHKTIGGFSIEQVKEARAEIETSLKNIFNKNQGQDLLGLTKDGRIDVRVNLIQDKKFGAKDIVGGDGTIEVKIEPVIDRDKQKKILRGVHEIVDGQNNFTSRDRYGGTYFFAHHPDSDARTNANESYAKEGKNGTIIEANTKAINVLTATFDREQREAGENSFENISSIKLLKHLFPGVDNFSVPGLRSADSDYVYQRFLNDMARQAGFDLFELENVEDGRSGEVSNTVAVLQESGIQYKGKIPKGYETETFDNHTKRAIISQQYGSATRFFEETLSRLRAQLQEAMTINAEGSSFSNIRDEGRFTYFNKDNFSTASALVVELQKVIPEIEQMAKSSLSALEKAISPYGGFIDDEVKRGLPQTVVHRDDGSSIGLVSEYTFKDMLQEFYNYQNSDRDYELDAATEKSEQLLNLLPDNLQEEGQKILYNFSSLEELTDEAIENVTKLFAPYAIYSDDMASTYYKPLEVETNGAPGGVSQAALDAEKERAKKAEEEAERERKAREEAERKAAEEKQAREHAEAEVAKKAKIGDSFARLSTLYNDSKSAQDESKLNDILEERKRILQELFLIMDDGDEYDNDFAAQQNLNKEIEAKITAIRANADTKNQKELTQPDALKKLSEYIRNSGKVPSEFFDDIIADSQLLSEDLKEILTTLKILDSQGNLKFESIHSGMSNLGGVTSETNTIISRDSKYIPKTKDLKPKLKQAREMGANVGDIIGAVVDKANNRIYELQRTMPGTIIPDNIEFLKATDEQILKLIKDLEILNKVGLHIDLLGDNILFDEEKGFSFIDLGTRPVDGEDEIKDVGTSLKAVLDKFALDFSNNPAFSEFQNSVANIAHGLGIEIPQAAEVARQNIEKVSKANEGVVTSANEVTEEEKKAARTAELVAEMESVGNVDDKTSVKELNAKQARLEEILQLLKNESLLTKEIQDRYNEINKIISDRRINHLFHSTKSQNPNAGSGTGDASRSELEAARNEADRLRNENQSLREDLNDEIHRSNQAEGDRAVAENKLVESEEKNAKLQQAHEEERKALDNIIASKNDEITRLQAEKEYAARETDSAYAIAYEERSRADEAEARANKLQEQLDKISAGKTSDVSKEQGGVFINKEELEGALKNIVYRVHIESSNIDGFNNEKKDISGNVGKEDNDKQLSGNGSKDDNPQIQTIIKLLERIKTHTHDTKRQIRDNLVPKIDEKFSALSDVSSANNSDDEEQQDHSETKKRNATSHKSDTSEKHEKDQDKLKQRKKDFNELIKLYEKLGKLQAKIDIDGVESHSNKLFSLEKEIEEKRASINLSKEELTVLTRIAEKAKDTQFSQLKDNQNNKDFNKKVREAKSSVAIKKSSSSLRKAEGLIFDTLSDEEYDNFDNAFKAKVKRYSSEINNFKELHANAMSEIEENGELSDNTTNELAQQTNLINKYTKELDELIATHNKLNGDNVIAKATSNLSPESSLKAYENGLTDFVEKITKGRGTITGFDADTKTLRYTIKGVKGETIECSAAVDHLAGSYVALQNKSRQTETLFDRLKRKTGEVATYLTSSLSIYTIINEVKKGIQYIREIDAAMTELKKVTNETEETYERFLDTAAKTGAKLGATISEVTEATATFSKLGYNMNLAADMAEAAIVYKNVGDNIASTEDAANSIISTLKGFGMQASESMEVVDRFNEIGNRFAITSQGIGEALRLSASALNEGGNSLDESIAMITAANEVVNDPSSVGEKLADIKVAQNEELTEKGDLVGKNM